MLYRLNGGFVLLLFCGAPCLLAGQPESKGGKSWGVAQTAAQIPDEYLGAYSECSDIDCKGCASCGSGWLSEHGTCCNMPQHHMYFPQSHGYYYFRPYNHAHIRRQQDAVTRWGGDPRNPYDNTIFQAMYLETPDAIGERAVSDVDSRAEEAEAPMQPTPAETIVEEPSLQQPPAPPEPALTLPAVPAEEPTPDGPLLETPPEAGGPSTPAGPMPEPTPAIIPPPPATEEPMPLQVPQDPDAEPSDEGDPFAPDLHIEPTTTHAAPMRPAIGLAFTLVLPGANTKKESCCEGVKQVSSRTYRATIRD
jgi:hypothetical protein